MTSVLSFGGIPEIVFYFDVFLAFYLRTYLAKCRHKNISDGFIPVPIPNGLWQGYSEQGVAVQYLRHSMEKNLDLK